MFFFRRKSPFSRHWLWRVKPLKFRRGFVLLGLIIILTVLFISHREPLSVPVSTGAKPVSQDILQKIYHVIGLEDLDHRKILHEGLPVGSLAMQNSDFLGEWDNFFHHIMLAITGVDSRNPALIMGRELSFSSLPGNAAVTALDTTIDENGEEDFYLPGQDDNLDDWVPIPDTEFPPVQLNGEPMILIYNTHNAESYRPSEGLSRQEGKNGGVVTVSKTLAQAIESKHKIKTLTTDIIHDYPDWTKSYINSMRTVQALLKQNSKIQTVIDIHRDAGLQSRSSTLTRINKKDCAKVLIVVGTEHPRWKENLAFAEKIEKKANEMYPDLIKGIRLAKGRRYNQHLHPRALLLEFGSDLNTLDDAKNSAKLMADVIAEVLKGK
ncbi:hypothetical protein BR63_07515 [Thermanaerosceptrum fracticalcis]|uniref:Stage II sporulation protein P n=1 Tax=Thermanaerosceptrum fracticalcis TaxID=1712410 RepID=A0A7G6E270_THEFR|nr:stage II sporulation protein P [Thermanaerosceptrum fracticalcis]QNB46174.1 hypothetical protein BR63_07515 [Thermanaerosceptrum fracticalcis]